MSIDGVVVTRPKIVTDHRGFVMRMLRVDDSFFAGFGEVYFSSVNCGRVKGWRRHREMTMTLAVPVGRLRLVLHDNRAGSPTCGSFQEVEFDGVDYKTVSVPPLVWTAFLGVSDIPALVVNCASIMHRPDEAEVDDWLQSKIAYRWPNAVARS